MEKNHIIGFILIFATLIVFNMINAPSKEELAKRKHIQDSIAQVEAAVAAQEMESISDQPITRDSSTVAGTDSLMVQEETERVVSLENEHLKLDFSTKGGFITSAVLKSFKNSYHPDRELMAEEMPLVELMSDTRDIFGATLKTKDGQIIETNRLSFVPSQSGNVLKMTSRTPQGKAVQFIYTLGEDYTLNFDIKLENISLDQPARILWSDYIPKLERGDFFEQRYSSVYYKKSDDDEADYCSCTGDDEEDMEGERIDWISHSNQFFNATIVARSKPFAGGVQKAEMIDLDKGEDLKRLESRLDLDFGGGDHYAMEMYIGPNDFVKLKEFEAGLENIIPYGSSIFGSINRWVVRPFFNFLSNFIGSKGLVIIVLIFIIKMLLYPLLYKMLYSQAKMAALKPELAGLKEKFKDEPQKVQMETMKVYQEYGVSPLSGCLPMVLQMPIWIALYRFFPANIDFRQESFLWSNDLSSYDSFFNLPFEIPFMGAHLSLFTILWAVTTIIYTYYNSRHMDLSANPAMKYVQYLMPMMFLGFFNTYASGLTAYMFFSNLINIIQIIITKNFVFDDEKIRKELLVQKTKPKKKSSFQSRFEEVMKQQQQMQAKKNKK